MRSNWADNRSHCEKRTRNLRALLVLAAAAILTVGTAGAYPRDLQNWSFEEYDGTGPSQWNYDLYNNISYAQSSGITHHGTYSLSITRDSYDTGNVIYQTIEQPVPEAFYTGSLWVLDNTTGSQVALEVKMFNAQGELIGQFIGDQSENSPEWQEITVAVYTYAETVTIEFIINLEPNFMFGEHTFYIDQASFYTEATVSEIQTAPSVYEERRIMTSGDITQGTNTIHKDFCDGYLQDGSAGINLYDPAPLPSPLERGDQVSVIARVEQPLEVTQLVDFTYEINDTGAQVPEPWRAPTGMLGGVQSMEGRWGEIRGTLTTAVGEPGDSYSIILDDGSGGAQVRIWADADLDLSGFDVGDNVRVSGTIDVEEGACFIQPSEQGDVWAVPDGIVFMIEPVSGDVPPGGGQTVYDLDFANNTGRSFNGLVAWRSILAPDGELYGPFQVLEFSVPAGFMFSKDGLSTRIPGLAPQGTYVVYHNIGFTTDHGLVWDQYVFEKTAER